MHCGHLDQATRQHLIGWAMDAEHPEVPLRVVVSVGGEVLASVLANRLRGDVLEAHGSGRHGFDIYLPSLSHLKRHLVSVRIEGSDEDLPGSPVVIEAGDAFDDESAQALKRIVAAADEPSLPRIADAFVDGLEAVVARSAALATQDTLRHFAFHRFRHRGGATSDDPPQPRRRALLVWHANNHEDLPGQDLVLVSYAESLVRLGYEVTLMAPCPWRRVPASLLRLAKQGVRFLTNPFAGSVEEVLRRQGPSFEVVFLSCLATALRYAFVARSECPAARIVYVKALSTDSLPTGSAKPGFAEALADFSNAERFVLSQVDAVAVPGAVVVPSRRGLARDVRVPWAASLCATPFHFDSRRGFAVRGPAATLSDLARWAETVVLPQVCAKDATLRLVDAAATPRLILAPGPTAHVEVVESLAAGIPCIASPNVLRDLGVPGGLHFCEPADLDALTDAVLSLHRAPLANRRARNEGLDFIDDQHALPALDDSMGSLLRHRRNADLARSDRRKEMSA